jgi:prepilin-type N-terminal cleavage/methylation domain-containing protein
MIKKLLKANDQSGFVLVEMLMAIAITALIIVGIVDITERTFVINAADNSQMSAIKQVENAIHRIERDAQMASANLILSINPTLPNFPLNLQWTSFDGVTHFVTYTLDNGVLNRTENASGNINETFICDNIIAADSNYTFNGKILEVNLKATVSDFRSATESRTLYVMPRVSN